eukprot:PhF_6_TR37563/c1_g1_i1/m.55655/K17065/DNM1L; dynamin 1-like protein
MEPLIVLMNELLDVFSRVDPQLLKSLELPQIAVVGSQSSGKSSVLEAIVGKSFLPRGSGIVTRRPLVLQLHQIPSIPKEGGGVQEWAEFLHKPGVKFQDFSEVRREIEAETDNVAGKNKNISPMPITLKIFSPNVLTLTLVDLPGLVRNAVGDQPKDIDKQVSELVNNYVKQPNVIILAVSAANADLATSDGIQTAQKVDKDGSRTLGVLTKLDLMDPGTDASDILEGKLIKLKRGFIGVVNMGQRDIDSKKEPTKHLEDEANFFASHPVYRRFADRCGIPYLAKTLSALLLNHIREILPALKAKIDDLLKMTTQELNKYGGEVSTEASHNAAQLLQLLTQYANNFNDAIAGKYAEAPKTEIWGGARVNYIFHEKFVPHIGTLAPQRDLTDDEIRVAISNSQGTRTALFPSQQAFETLLQGQIRRLEDPCLRCVSFVFDELVRISDFCSTRMDRYPLLRRRIFEVSVDLLKINRPLVEEHLRTTIAAESAYINTNHPDFGDATQIMATIFAPTPAPQGGQNPPTAAHTLPPPRMAAGGLGFDDVPSHITQTGPLSEKEARDHKALRILIEKYFNVVKKTIQDQTPKIVTFFLIGKMTENLRNYLVSQLYKDALIPELLKESNEVATRRKAATQMYKCLTEAKAVLDKIRDTRISM